MRNYQIKTPSLDGMLHHDSITYEGIRRPFELLRIMDSPLQKKTVQEPFGYDVIYTPDQSKVIQQYVQDLHVLFMKRFAQFMIESEVHAEETVILQAMLQDLIKVKNLIGKQVIEIKK